VVGGRDIVMACAGGSRAVEIAVRTVRQFWPKAVYENAETGEVAERFDRIAFGRVKELLIYRDAAAAKRWEDLGADPSLDGTLIHVLAGRGDLVLVVDEPAGMEMEKIVASVGHAVRKNALGRWARKEAA
jgi:hypothetical protein